MVAWPWRAGGSQASRVAGCAQRGPRAPQSRCSACRAGRELICQSWLETSVFPPSTLKSPPGRANLRAAAASRATRHPAWLAGSGAREGCGPTAELPSGCLHSPARSSPGPDLRQKGAQADDPVTTERGRKLHLPEAVKLPGPVGKRAGNPRSSAPAKLARSGNQPWNSLR